MTLFLAHLFTVLYAPPPSALPSELPIPPTCKFVMVHNILIKCKHCYLHENTASVGEVFPGASKPDNNQKAKLQERKMCQGIGSIKVPC